VNWFRRIFLGDDTHRPSITPIQIISGVPLLANLLAAWGIFAPTQAQQDSLTNLIPWAIGLVAADAIVRSARNIGDGMKAKSAPPPPTDV
jgi:hypothetical protein